MDLEPKEPINPEDLPLEDQSPELRTNSSRWDISDKTLFQIRVATLLVSFAGLIAIIASGMHISKEVDASYERRRAIMEDFFRNEKEQEDQIINQYLSILTPVAISQGGKTYPESQPVFRGINMADRQGDNAMTSPNCSGYMDKLGPLGFTLKDVSTAAFEGRVYTTDRAMFIQDNNIVTRIDCG